MSEYVVYRLLAADGAVLYVGCSSRFTRRLADHRKKAWFSEVASWTTETFPDRETARAAERELIALLSPPHNLLHTKAWQNAVRERNRLAAARRPPKAPKPPHVRVNAHLPLPEREAEILRGLMAEVHHGPRARPFLAYSYIHLLHRAGWSMQAIGDACGRTRQRIQQIIEIDVPPCPAFPAVSVPVRPQPEAVPPKRQLHVRPEIAEHLRSLAAKAKVNGGTPEDHPAREAAQELVATLHQLSEQGVTLSELARVLGVTRFAVESRLARHGYRTPTPSCADITYLGRRGNAGPKAACKRGHALSGDNVRLVNGDPSHRVCRECERIRCAAYRARQASTTALLDTA